MSTMHIGAVARPGTANIYMFAQHLGSTIMRVTHTDWPVFTCHFVPHAASKPLRVTIKKMTPNG